MFDYQNKENYDRVFCSNKIGLTFFLIVLGLLMLGSLISLFFLEGEKFFTGVGMLILSSFVFPFVLYKRINFKPKVLVGINKEGIFSCKKGFVHWYQVSDIYIGKIKTGKGRYNYRKSIFLLLNQPHEHFKGLSVFRKILFFIESLMLKKRSRGFQNSVPFIDQCSVDISLEQMLELLKKYKAELNEAKSA